MFFFRFIGFTSFLILVKTNKPNDKEQQTVWRVECELGLIIDSECPVDGVWSPWSPWSACNGLCDDLGHRRRVRECNNPSPSQDGLPCPGVESQIESCHITNCTIDDYRKLVAGDSLRKQALRQVEAVPALMERCLLMQCPLEAIEAGLATENTWQINSESLWNSLQCIKHNLGCPVMGEWGSWSEWSACGARCGYGTRWRVRKCDSPPPSSVHFGCAGTPLQVDECEGDQCAVYKSDSGGKWASWGQWSVCSEMCGTGIRRRKRNCLEMNTSRWFSPWGTHCRGEHDQLKVCENKECKLDGGWSVWGPWGPCSQTCGAGRRSRSRSCTRPEPSGSGTFCSGTRTEVGSCHITPCQTYSHMVALFNGESSLYYNFENKRSTLFHLYVRFLPLSPHGTLVRRGDGHDPRVRLSLQKWHICLDASGLSLSCTVPRICSPTVLEPAVWHSVLVTVTNEATTMRVDDAPVAIRSSFPCDPELPNDKVNIFVGERLHGEIQEIILNFIPLGIVMKPNHNSVWSSYGPSTGSNIAYEKAGTEEAYLTFDNDQFLRLPCMEDQDEWKIKLTIKAKTETGSIIFLHNNYTQTWLHLYLQNTRLKLILAVADFRSESVSSSSCLPEQWHDLTLTKNRGTDTVEASINVGERLHAHLEDVPMKRRMYHNYSITDSVERKSGMTLCIDEYYVGGVPADVQHSIPFVGFTSFSGVIASIIVNNGMLDLKDFSMERYKDNHIQLSSRTASVSGSYHETGWGKSNHLNLTCLHTYTVRAPSCARWLYLDTVISGDLRKKAVQSTDDGRVLRLAATADNDLRGFYTCRAHGNKRSRNVVTYGVIGQIKYQLSGPDLTTAIAVITTLALVLGTLVCLFIEGIHDIRNGYGFFRDAHLSAEEEAETICKYIDQNMHLMASISAADTAKAYARRTARQLECHASFGAQEPEGLMEAEYRLHSTGDLTQSAPECLPALPEIKTCSTLPMLDVIKCEQSFASSSRHGLIPSTRTRLSSSSSYELTSPRVICSRLLLSKHLHSSLESLTSRKNKISRLPRKNNLNMPTIKSYVNVNQSQKILEKFQVLKRDDIDDGSCD